MIIYSFLIFLDLVETKNINRIVLDNENLSVELPNEEKRTVTLEKKMIQDITFSACLYSACQKLQEVSNSTKAGLEKAKAEGKRIGRPAGENSNEKNFYKILNLIVNHGLSQKKACSYCKFPYRTFQDRLYVLYKKNNVKTQKEVYQFLEKENKI